MATRFSPETLALGLALILMGVVATLGNLGYLDTLRTLRTFWPVTLIVWGLLELWNALDAKAAAGRAR